MNEEWRIIKDFPDYAVSNLGRVKRLTDSANNRKSGFILNTKPHRFGYVVVVLFRDGKRHQRMVHKLVLSAFIGYPPSDLHQANHIDGIKHHNEPNNLEWVTAQENINHAFRTGLNSGVKGESNNLSKLKEGEVWLIKRLLAHGVFQWKIADMFKVNRALISYIHNEKIWREVKYDGPSRPTTIERGTGSIKKGSRIGWSGKWQNKNSHRTDCISC